MKLVCNNGDDKMRCYVRVLISLDSDLPISWYSYVMVIVSGGLRIMSLVAVRKCRLPA